MGYYRGDYYRGDSNYYRGDPFLGGLLAIGGKLLGKVAGKAAKWVGKQVTGGGGSVVKSIVKDALPSTIAGVAGYQLGQAMPALPGMPTMPMLPSMGPMQGGPGGGNTQIFTTPSGRAIKKRWSVSEQRWIAVRKMNPLNPRALGRGLRRAEGFEKFAKRTVNALYRTVDGRRVKTFKRKGRKT